MIIGFLIFSGDRASETGCYGKYTGLGGSFGSFAHITLKVWLHLLYFGLLTTVVQTGTSLRVKGGAVNNDPRMFLAK